MRQNITLALALLVTGCANARYMCGLQDQPQWRQAYRPPPNASVLTGLIPHRSGFGPSYEQNHQYWFSRPDGALLVCRQDPQQPDDLGRCNSDGWSFTPSGDKWQVREEWSSWCVE
jgi:hypothetical protein